MLIALPVLPLDASTIVSPGRSRPSRSARSIMYFAMRALTEPDGLRNSSLTHTSSTRTSGVLPIASRIVVLHASVSMTVMAHLVSARDLRTGTRDYRVVPVRRLGRVLPMGQLTPVPWSHAATLSGLASIHFLAASSSFMFSLAMYSATLFWSSLV